MEVDAKIQHDRGVKFDFHTRALSCVVTGITGASVDMLSEVKHSVTVKYWGVAAGLVLSPLFAALVLATLCGVFGGAELFWLVLLRWSVFSSGCFIFGVVRSAG